MEKIKIENSLDYYVNKEGRIFRKDKELKKNKSHTGYITVSIKYENGDRKVRFVHRLVAQAFIPNPEDKPVVNHKNLIKNDNRVENLEWVTYLENNLHAHENGAMRTNGAHNKSLYTAEVVHKICELLQEGRRIVDIAKTMCVPACIISSIRQRQNWLHISKDYTFPVLKNRQLSDITVKWVSHMIAEGKTNKEISELSYSKIKSSMLCDIRKKKCYRDITDKYF